MSSVPIARRQRENAKEMLLRKFRARPPRELSGRARDLVHGMGLFAVSRRRDALDARTQVSEGQTGGSFPRLFAPHSIKQGNSGGAREEVEEEGAAHSVLHSTEKFSGEGCSRARAPFCRAAPCNAAHEPCHRAGKLFLSIYSPPSFFLTPPTNKGRGCHSPKKTSGGIQNFFGTPSP